MNMFAVDVWVGNGNIMNSTPLNNVLTYLHIPTNYIYETIFAIVLLSIYIILMRGIHFLLFKILERFSKKTKTKLDDILIEHTRTVSFVFIVSLGFYFLLGNLSYLLRYENYIDRIYISFLFVIFGWFIYSIINSLIESYAHKLAKKTKTDIDETLIPIVTVIIKTLVWVVVIFEIFSLWHVDLSPLLASAGVFGIALAFAAQETIKNLFGGISVSVDKSLKVGDWVILDGAKMQVKELGMRSTKFLTLDGTLKIYPNSIIAQNVIENLSQPKDVPKKVKITIGVGYGSDPEKVKRILKEEAEKIDKVDKSSINVFMTEMAAYSINFLLVCNVPTIDDVWPVKTQLIERIYNRLRAEGIEIPFPTNTVYLRKENLEEERGS